MIGRSVVLLAVLLLCSSAEALAVDEGGGCKLSEMVTSHSEKPFLDLRLRTPLTPSDQPIVVDIFGPTSVRTTEVFFQAAYDLGVHHDLDVVSWKPSEHTSEANAPIGVLTLSPVSANWYAIFPRMHVYVLACKNKNELAYGSIDAPISVWGQAAVLAATITIVAYVLCALGFTAAPLKERLNPIWLARDFTGRASLSQMQIIFFSVIVLFLVAYILLLTGVLASLSEQVLLLLGIAGLGSVAGKIGTYNTSRLEYANIAWAIRKNWMDDQGWQVDEPKVSDLVTTAGEFDPYKFQMLTFSAVVGIALLIIGVNGLADFAIPQSLLGIIGLSQVTYVSGKVFGSGSMAELDDALTKLREIEAKFLQKSAAEWPPKRPPASPTKPTRAAIDLDRAGYMEFEKAVGPVWTMFSQLIPHHTDAPFLEPSP